MEESPLLFSGESQKKHKMLKIVALSTIFIFLGVILLTLIVVGAVYFTKQNKDTPMNLYSFDDIFNSTLSPKGTQGIEWQSQDSFTYWQQDGSDCSLVEENVKTGAIATLVSNAVLKENGISCSTTYGISNSGQYIFLAKDSEKVWRHSYKARFVVYDTQAKTVFDVSPNPNAKQSLAIWCSAAPVLAYVEDRNVFVLDVENGKTVAQVTTNGGDQAFNGIPDWVYEEEVLGTNYAMWWSPDCSRLAYLSFNDTNVDTYPLPFYESTSAYPTIEYIRYPTPGTVNPNVFAYVYERASDSSETLPLASITGLDPTMMLIYGMHWYGTTNNNVALIVLNRQQNHKYVVTADTSDMTDIKTAILKEQTSQKWIDEGPENAFFIPDTNYYLDIVPNNGYKAVAVFDSTTGKLLSYVSTPNYDVRSLYASYNAASKSIFYSAAYPSPIHNNIFTVSLSGIENTNYKPNVQCITAKDEDAYYAAEISPDGQSMVLIYQGPQVPTYNLYKIAFGTNNAVTIQLAKTLQDNSALKAALASFDLPTINYTTIPNDYGDQLNAYIMYPPGFKKSRAYPVLINVYGGPGSQTVTKTFLNPSGFNSYVASSLDIIIVSADGRGTGARGEEWEMQTYKNLGVKEAEDQVAVAKWLAKQSWVDPSKIGIWGWSFGGYMTLMSTLTSKVFAMGISVAPVSDWRFYDSVYTERYMDLLENNDVGYKNTSSILPKINRGSYNSTRLLMIHGSADDNVHPINYFEVTKRLVENEIQYDTYVYTNKDHSITGGNTRRHLYKRLSNELLMFLSKKASNL